MDTNKDNLTPEELKAEQEALAESKAEEVRSKVIEEFGFDPETDQERIDKLVTMQMESRKVLSQAIGAKIKHRTDAQKLRQELSTKVVPPKQDVDVSKLVAEQIAAALENQGVESLEYPDELKAEIKQLAKIKGSVKAAKSDPYIQWKITEYEKTSKVEEAAISRKNNASGKTDFDIGTPPQIDTSSPDKFKASSEAYEKWVEEAKKRGY